MELYGAEKKVQLPFVMGVLADLSGKPADPLAPVGDRKFLEFDVDNFDTRMKAMKPRAAFAVPNTLTGEGELKVDLTFENMDDFSPAAVAKKVDALNKLLEARNQLSNLVTYMDGKGGAEELLAKVLEDPELLQDAGRQQEAGGRRRHAGRLKPTPSNTRRSTMAEALEQQSALKDVAYAGSDFASLLQKEFKPRSDEAKSAVEAAVLTLAQQALARRRSSART